MNNLDLFNKCIEVVEQEPELPDEMPDEMYKAIIQNKKIATESFRALVRATKQSIKERMEQLKSEIEAD